MKHIFLGVFLATIIGANVYLFLYAQDENCKCTCEKAICDACEKACKDNDGISGANCFSSSAEICRCNDGISQSPVK